MEKEWLTDKTSIEEAEKNNELKSEQWLEIKKMFQENDEIWEFSSPYDSWLNLAGRAGICIVRDGKILDSIVIWMN